MEYPGVVASWKNKARSKTRSIHHTYKIFTQYNASLLDMTRRCLFLITQLRLSPWTRRIVVFPMDSSLPLPCDMFDRCLLDMTAFSYYSAPAYISLS